MCHCWGGLLLAGLNGRIGFNNLAVITGLRRNTFRFDLYLGLERDKLDRGKLWSHLYLRLLSLTIVKPVGPHQSQDMNQ